MITKQDTRLNALRVCRINITELIDELPTEKRWEIVESIAFEDLHTCDLRELAHLLGKVVIATRKSRKNNNENKTKKSKKSKKSKK